MMPVLLENRQQMIPLTDELADLVIKAVTCGLALAGMSEAEVGITLVDDETIAQLNSDYRGIAAKTDVLSFSQLVGEEMPTVGGQLLGDIVISLPTAQAQAQEYGHSLAREVCYLAVHGLLHLLGADHGAQMRAREEEILQQVGLARHA